VALPNDRELIAQLTSRRGWPDSKGRLVLEPKSDLRSRNLPSPDRADAVLGAMFDLVPGRAPAKFEWQTVPRPNLKGMDVLGGGFSHFDRRIMRGKGCLY
jgi:hypothetical protein